MTSIAKTNFHQGITTPKKKAKKNVGGSLVALLAAGATQNIPKNIFMPKILEGLKKPNLELTEDQIEIVNNGAKKVFNDITNLAKKGVKFNDYQITPYTSVVQAGDFKSDFKAGLSAALEGIFGRAVANGDNAFFIGKSPSWLAEAMENIGFEQNSINVNMKKLPLASFHETGHAFNFNNSAVWKTIQKANKIKVLAPLFVMIPALTKEHKAQEGQELTKKQKFVNGLRKACPFLAGATMLPTVLEEGMATLRANNWAKEVFKDTPELAKKVAKGNKWGFISYSMIAILTVLASLVAKKVKDASNKKFSSQINEGTKARKDLGYHQGRS